jgi:hypothetical protein
MNPLPELLASARLALVLLAYLLALWPIVRWLLEE